MRITPCSPAWSAGPHPLFRERFMRTWRRDEVESLTWEQVDVKGREVRLWDSKNTDAGVLPLEAEPREVVERRAGLRKFETASGPALSTFVFHKDGKPRGVAA
jgi:integrase